MAELTISEALGVKKLLSNRYSELVSLRNENSKETRRYRGADAEKFTDEKPVYDVKELDKMITTIAREQRLLDQALKQVNAKTKLKGYNWDDAVLGELK